MSFLTCPSVLIYLHESLYHFADYNLRYITAFFFAFHRKTGFNTGFSDFVSENDLKASIKLAEKNITPEAKVLLNQIRRNI